MKNREKFSKELAEFACCGESFGVVNNEVRYCEITDCNECLFGKSIGLCRDEREKWCEQEFNLTPSISPDTPVGTIVEVRIDEKSDWCLRRFVKIYYNPIRCMFEYVVVASGFSDEKEHGTGKFDYCRIAK